MSQNSARTPLELIDEIATRFEENWHPERPPRIADFVQDSPSGQRTALLQELIMVDMGYRWSHGAPRNLDEYLREFPELRGPDGAPPLPLVECQDRLRQRLSGESTAVYRSVADHDAEPAAIGKYRVLEKLGRGGQADVYRALHPSTRKDVAIKWSRTPRSLVQGAWEAIQAEGGILARLDHPNLARMFDVDVYQDRVFLVMEYVQGRNLAQFVQGQKLTFRQAAMLVRGVAWGAEAIHRQGIVHQDLKPANILIDEKGEPRLIDFGLARLRHAWVDESRQPEGGTAAYMSPEQARGDSREIGPKSDVFALGGVLYFLLTGQPPFVGANQNEVIEKARQNQFDEALLRQKKVPGRLTHLCLQALATEPTKRPTAAEFARRLDGYVWRSKWLRPIGVAVLVLALVLGLILLLATLPKPQEPSAAKKRESGELGVRLWRNDKWGELVPPLNKEDKFKLIIKVPANLHASLFEVDGRGRLSRLMDVTAQEAAFETTYPAKQTARLTGPSGTELFLVCLTESGPVDETNLRAFWDEQRSWPALPAETVLRIVDAEVKFVQRGRPVELARDEPDPEEDVRLRLQAFHRRTHNHIDQVLGIAFAYRNGH